MEDEWEEKQEEMMHSCLKQLREINAKGVGPVSLQKCLYAANGNKSSNSGERKFLMLNFFHIVYRGYPPLWLLA